ncbi:MAG TPA: L,D-transpeptidase [Rhizomicrobium sp.]|nr:L,D-transpeptidase [Rhizomicrobium sp.]
MVRVREFAAVASVAMLAMSTAFWIQKLEANTALQAAAAKWVPGFSEPEPLATVDTAPRKSVAPQRLAPAQLVATGDAPRPLSLPVRVSKAALPPPPSQEPSVAPQPAPPPPAVETGGASADSVAVAERVRQSVPAELFPYFDVYLYVSKSASGAWAQHMFVFHKTGDGRLAFEEAFPVSTGRERAEKYFTSTPAGLFELDPNRFDADHRSHRWNNAPMPWAMFLNYTIHNHETGVALHSGVGHVALLGQRASGGCVRMPPEKAEAYFHRFQASEQGEVPVFAFDNASGTTRTDGMLQRDMAGKPVLTEGYRVLLIIQDYPGGPATVAVVS